MSKWRSISIIALWSSMQQICIPVGVACSRCNNKSNFITVSHEMSRMSTTLSQLSANAKTGGYIIDVFLE